MEHLTSHVEHLEWRRDKIQELTSKGHSQREIASILQIGLASVNRDLTFIRQKTMSVLYAASTMEVKVVK